MSELPLRYIYPDLRNMPKGTEQVPVHAVVEKELADKWKENIENNKKFGEFPIHMEETDVFNFDAGGMCRRADKMLETTINGWSFSTMLRHADIVLECCQNIQTYLDWLGDHIFLPGRWTKGVFTVETGTLIREWLEEVYDEKEAEKEWSDLYDSIGNIKGLKVVNKKEVKNHG